MIDVGKKIGVWGDSILRGVVLDEREGTYQMLQKNCVERIRETVNVQILNRSRFGCTIEKGRKQLFKALDKGIDCDAVLLEYGGNDCDFNWPIVAAKPHEEHLPLTPVDRFCQVLGDMIDALRQRKIEPILMSLPPISSQRYFDFIVSKGVDAKGLLQFLGHVHQIYQHHELYSLLVSGIAAEKKTYYVPIREHFLQNRCGEECLCRDGIHPNEQGHARMQEAFTQFAMNWAT